MKRRRLHLTGIVVLALVFLSACAQLQVKVDIFDPKDVTFRERYAQTKFRSLLTLLVSENEKTKTILEKDILRLRDQLFDIYVACPVSAKQPEANALKSEAAGKAKAITDEAQRRASEIKIEAETKAKNEIAKARKKTEQLIKDVKEKQAPAILRKAVEQAQAVREAAMDKPKTVKDQAEEEAKRIIEEAQARKNQLIEEAEERTKPDLIKKAEAEADQIRNAAEKEAQSIVNESDASAQKLKKKAAIEADTLIRKAKKEASYLIKNAQDSYDKRFKPILTLSESIQKELTFDSALSDVELGAQRIRISINFFKRHKKIKELIEAMAKSYGIFQDACKKLEDKNKFPIKQILARMNPVEEQIVNTLTDTSNKDEALAKIAEEPAIISATDPNIPLLLDPENEEKWRSAVSLSKAFGSFGKGEMIIVQNSLADYRVKTLKNDITEAVKGMTGLIQESIRAVALVYGVPLPKGQTEGSKPQSSPPTDDSLPDIQVDIDLAEKRREALSLIKRDLRVFVSSRIRMYEDAPNSGSGDAVRKKILAEVRGRIMGAIIWIENNTSKRESQKQ